MTSLVEKNILDQEITPIIYGNNLFSENNNRFALGVFSSSDVLNYEKTNNFLVKGYLQLRANVYIDRANILGSEARRHDGTELDEYDKRSIHFVAFERRPEGVAVIASSRLIIKNSNNDLLPIESVFKNRLPISISDNGVEVSRFIINDLGDDRQSELKARIIMAELAFVLENKLGPVFGTIEERLRRSLVAFGIYTDILAGPMSVKEGGNNGNGTHITELIAVRIRTDSLENRFSKEDIQEMNIGIGRFFYWGKYDK